MSKKRKDSYTIYAVEVLGLWYIARVCPARAFMRAGPRVAVNHLFPDPDAPVFYDTRTTLYLCKVGEATRRVRLQRVKKRQ